MNCCHPPRVSPHREGSPPDPTRPPATLFTQDQRLALRSATAGGGGLLAAFYLLQALGMRSLTFPFSFFAQKWFFILPLVLSFAIQMGLFGLLYQRRKVGGGTLAISGGSSTGSMVACCLHNIAPLVPFFGLAGLATFLTRYQDPVFLGSIALSLTGLVSLIHTYRRTITHQTCPAPHHTKTYEHTSP